VSLALATLLYEWRRYLAAVIALAFSGLLVLAQVGLFMGIGQAATATVNRAAAEIMVLAPQSESLINTSAGLPRRIRPTLYLHPEVLSIEEMAGTGTMMINQPKPGERRKESQIQIMAVDPYQGSPSLPRDFSEETRLALVEPMTIAVDRTAQDALGVKLGEYATVNGRKVRVAALLDGYPNVMDITVVMSRQTLRAVGLANRGIRSGPLMVRIRNPERASIVRDELNAASNGAYKAWLRTDLADANERAMLQEQIIGAMLVFSVVLGAFIGVGITSQTLRGAILASIKEFASLRALGVSMGSLRMIVLELSWWIGLAGLAVTGVLVALVAMLAAQQGLPMAFPVPMVLQTVAFMMFIAMLSGIMALGMLKKSQPADLLR
jgi:putative ABC transport system permease protein